MESLTSLQTGVPEPPELCHGRASLRCVGLEVFQAWHSTSYAQPGAGLLPLESRGQWAMAADGSFAGDCTHGLPRVACAPNRGETARPKLEAEFVGASLLKVRLS